MAKIGEVYVNPVTGERAVVRTNPQFENGGLLLVDLFIAPGGAVVGKHLHPEIEERFTVLRGQVGFVLGHRRDIAGPGTALVAPAGVVHDWWNAGPEEALVRVAVCPGTRFQAMIRNFYGLAQDGKTNRRGMPNLLQLALLAREFSDVVRFTSPPPMVQRALFAGLAPVARAFGYRGNYPEYQTRAPSATVPLED